MKRIPKIPQGEISSIKNILYPDINPKEQKYEIKSINKEEINKKKKEEEESVITANDLYNINLLKNYPSYLKKDSNPWINSQEQIENNTPKTPLNLISQRGNSQSKMTNSNKRNKPITLPSLNKEEENIYDILNTKKDTMFDQYYSNRTRSKTPYLLNRKNNYENNNKNNLFRSNIQVTPLNLNENNINHIYNDNCKKSNKSELQANNSYGINNISSIDKLSSEEPKTRDSSEIERLIQEYKLKYGSDEALENIINDYSKNNLNQNTNIANENDANLNCIPEVDEKLETTMKRKKNTLLPKIQKNFIKENRKLIHDNKIPLKNKNNEEINNLKHKNYGKVPNYIKRFELEREIKKEEIKRQKELKKIPKGMKLLSEEERLSTLNGLILNKKELINQLEKMPITTRTLAVQNKKEELSQKLDEIEKAIEMFSKKQVFIHL